MSNEQVPKVRIESSGGMDDGKYGLSDGGSGTKGQFSIKCSLPVQPTTLHDESEAEDELLAYIHDEIQKAVQEIKALVNSLQEAMGRSRQPKEVTFAPNPGRIPLHRYSTIPNDRRRSG